MRREALGICFIPNKRLSKYIIYATPVGEPSGLQAKRKEPSGIQAQCKEAQRDFNKHQSMV